MKKVKLCGSIVVLLVVVIGMLSGCGIKKFDGGVYTKACLDASYKGEFDEYIKMTKISKEEAQDDYEENIEALVEQYEDLGVSDALLEQYEQLYTELLKKAKYTIKSAEEDKDKNFTVDVEIEPMKIFEGTGEATMVEVQKYVDELVNAGTEPTEEELNEKLFQVLHDLLATKLDNITYNEKQVVTIKVTKSEDNIYEISEADYLKMDEKMFDIDMLKFE